MIVVSRKLNWLFDISCVKFIIEMVYELFKTVQISFPNHKYVVNKPYPVQYVLIPVCLVYRGLVSKETVVLRRWGSDTRKLGLSTELIM